MKKLLAILMVLVMSFAFSSIAFADGYEFNGRCTNKFKTRQFNKVNDTWLEVCLRSVSYVSGGSGTPAVNVQFYVGSSAVGSERSLSVQSNYNEYGTRSYSTLTGSAYAKIINVSSPRNAVHAYGAFFIYGTTPREINQPAG